MHTMKKHILILLTLIITMPLVLGAHHTSQELLMDVTIGSEVNLVETGNINFDYLEIRYQLNPLAYYRQNPADITAQPQAYFEGDNLVYRFENFQSRYPYQVNFQTVNSKDRVKITEKVDYPIRNLDSSLTRYTQESGLINLNSDIRRTASDLARNEDDLYKVAVNIADWVNNNVEYDLSTLSEEAEKQSTWVFENRQGVCTEISNLYISMLRSLGIPSRFVTGIAYTESELFQDNWGLHGWTEVYFPGYGWVPFDPTYGQNGYVDATHISLEKAVEGGTFNTNFRWRGTGFDVQTDELQINIDTTVLQEHQQELALEVQLEETLVGFNSYNIVQAKITNLQDYYVAERVALGRTRGLDYITNREKEVVLKPNQEKIVEWVVRIHENQQSGFSYTFPVSVQTGNERVETSFSSVEQGRQIQSPDLIHALPDNMIYCHAPNPTGYVGEDFTIVCDSSLIGQVEVCVNEICEQQSVSQEFTITHTPQNPGFQAVEITADGERSHASINVLDEANLEIKELPDSLNATYANPLTLEFFLEKTSSSVAENIKIRYEHDYFTMQQEVERIESVQPIQVILDSNVLKPNNNDVQITVSYEDSKGKQFKTSKDVQIVFDDLTLLQRIRLHLNVYRKWIK